MNMQEHRLKNGFPAITSNRIQVMNNLCWLIVKQSRYIRAFASLISTLRVSIAQPASVYGHRSPLSPPLIVTCNYKGFFFFL